MKLPLYLTAAKRFGEDAMSTPIVLRTKNPMIVGYPYKVRGSDDERKMREACEGGWAVKVPGYRIYITNGTRLDKPYPYEKNGTEVLEEMALVFLTECIEPHKFRYKDYVDNDARKGD